MNRDLLEQSIRGQSNFIKQNILYNGLDKNELPFSSLMNLQLYDGQIVNQDTFNEVLSHFLDNDLFIENYIYTRDTMTLEKDLFNVFHIQKYNLTSGIENLDGTNRSLMLQTVSKMFLSYDDFQHGEFFYSNIDETSKHAWSKGESVDPSSLKQIKSLFGVYYGIYGGDGTFDSLEYIPELNVFNNSVPVDFMAGFKNYYENNIPVDLKIYDFIQNPFSTNIISEAEPINNYMYLVGTNKGLFGFEAIGKNSTNNAVKKLNNLYINLSLIDKFTALKVIEAASTTLLFIEAIDRFNKTRFFFYSIDPEYNVVENGLREINGLVVDGVYENELNSIITNINNFSNIDSKTFLATNNSFWDIELNDFKVNETFIDENRFQSNKTNEDTFVAYKELKYDKAGAWLPAFEKNLLMAGVDEDFANNTWKFNKILDTNVVSNIEFPLIGTNFVGGITSVTSSGDKSKLDIELLPLDNSFYTEDELNKAITYNPYEDDFIAFDWEQDKITNSAFSREILSYIKAKDDSTSDAYFQIRDISDLTDDKWILLLKGNDDLKMEIQKTALKTIHPLIYGLMDLDSQLTDRWNKNLEAVDENKPRFYWINEFLTKFDSDIKYDFKKLFDQDDINYTANLLELWEDFNDEYGSKTIKDIIKSCDSSLEDKLITVADLSTIKSLDIAKFINNLADIADSKVTTEGVKSASSFYDPIYSTYKANYLVNHSIAIERDVLLDGLKIDFNKGDGQDSYLKGLNKKQSKDEITALITQAFKPIEWFADEISFTSELTSRNPTHTVDLYEDFLKDYFNSLLLDFTLECDGLFDQFKVKLNNLMVGNDGEHLDANETITSGDITIGESEVIKFNVTEGKKPLISLVRPDVENLISEIKIDLNSILSAITNELDGIAPVSDHNFRDHFIKHILPRFAQGFFNLSDDDFNNIPWDVIDLLDNSNTPTTNLGAYEIYNHMPGEFHLSFPGNFNAETFFKNYLNSQANMLRMAITMPSGTSPLTYIPTYNKTLLKILPNDDQPELNNGVYVAPVKIVFMGENTTFEIATATLNIPKAFVSGQQLNLSSDNIRDFITNNNELILWNLYNPPKKLYVNHNVKLGNGDAYSPDQKRTSENEEPTGWSTEYKRDAALAAELCTDHKTWEGVKVAVRKEDIESESIDDLLINEFHSYSISIPSDDDDENVEIMIDYSYPPHVPGLVMEKSEDQHYNIIDQFGRFGWDLNVDSNIPTNAIPQITISNFRSSINLDGRAKTRSSSVNEDGDIEFGWFPDNTKVSYMLEGAESFLNLDEKGFNPYNKLFQKYLIGENNLIQVPSTVDTTTNYVMGFTDKGIDNITKFLSLDCDFSMDALTLEMLRRVATHQMVVKKNYNCNNKLCAAIGRDEIFYSPVDKLDFHGLQTSFINSVVDLVRYDLFRKLLDESLSTVKINETFNDRTKSAKPYVSYISNMVSFGLSSDESNAAADLFNNSPIIDALRSKFSDELINKIKLEFETYVATNPDISISLENDGVKFKIALASVTFEDSEVLESQITFNNVSESLTVIPNNTNNNDYDEGMDAVSWKVTTTLSNGNNPDDLNIEYEFPSITIPVTEWDIREEIFNMVDPQVSTNMFGQKFKLNNQEIIDYVYIPFKDLRFDWGENGLNAGDFAKLNVSETFIMRFRESPFAKDYLVNGLHTAVISMLEAYNKSIVAMKNPAISSQQNEYRNYLTLNKPFSNTDAYIYDMTYDLSLTDDGLISILNQINDVACLKLLNTAILEEYQYLVNNANTHPSNPNQKWEGYSREALEFWGRYKMFENGSVKSTNHKRVDYEVNGIQYGYYLDNGFYWEVYDSINVDGKPFIYVENFLKAGESLASFIVNGDKLEYVLRSSDLSSKINSIGLDQIKTIMLDQYLIQYDSSFKNRPMIKIRSEAWMMSVSSSFLYYPIIDMLTYRAEWYVAKCQDPESYKIWIYISDVDKYFRFYDFDNKTEVDIADLCYFKRSGLIFLVPEGDNRIFIFNINAIIQKEYTLSSSDADMVLTTPYTGLEKLPNGNPNVLLERLLFIESRIDDGGAVTDNFLYAFFQFEDLNGIQPNSIYPQFVAYRIGSKGIETMPSNNLVIGNTGLDDEQNHLQHYLWDNEVYDLYKSKAGEFSYIVKEYIKDADGNEKGGYRIYHMLEGIISPTQQTASSPIKFLHTNDATYPCYIFKPRSQGRFELRDANITDENKHLYKYYNLTENTFTNVILPYMVEAYGEDSDKLNELEYYDINMLDYHHEDRHSMYFFLTSEGFFIFSNYQNINQYPYRTFDDVSTKYFNIFNDLINLDGESIESHLTRDHKGLLIERLIADKFKVADFNINDFVPFTTKSEQVGTIPERIDSNDKLKTVKEHLSTSIITERNNIPIASLAISAKENPGMVSAAIKSPYTQHHPDTVEFGMGIDDSESSQYYDKAYTDDGFIFNLHKLPVIFNLHSNHTFDLYVNIPTTATKYLNRPAGALSSIDHTTRVEDRDSRPRLNMNSESMVNTLTDSTTSLRLYIDLDYFNIGKIHDIEISGNSIPLSIYRDGDANGAMYDSIAMKSRWDGDQEVIKTNLSANTLRLTFTIYGTDSQSIRISGALSSNTFIFNGEEKLNDQENFRTR